MTQGFNQVERSVTFMDNYYLLTRKTYIYNRSLLGKLGFASLIQWVRKEYMSQITKMITRQDCEILK